MKKSLLALSSLAIAYTTVSLAGDPRVTRVVWDDFQQGMTIGAPGSSAKWFYQQVGPLVYNDATATTDHLGLHLVPLGTNQQSGMPTFSLTVGQEGSADDPYNLPGDTDHPKFLVFANHIATSGIPGFDLVPGQEFACETEVWGRTYGVSMDPFHVPDPEADPRLASYALNGIDFETFMVADFFVTNEEIYALYERLPFARGTLGNYASFTHTMAVAPTHPDEHHKLALAFDRSAGTIRWLVDRHEVFRVTQIGQYLDRSKVTIDRGGTPITVSPRQIDCGIGTFTLLDGYRPGNIGLVELSNAPNYYFDPNSGPPTPATFMDTQSLHDSRLWGQGAVMNVKSVVMSYRRSSDPDKDNLSGD